MAKPGARLRAAGSAALFLGLTALTFYLLLRGEDPARLLAVVRAADARFLLAAAGCMALFVLCEALNLRAALRALGRAVPFRDGIHYALTGFFFSSVTPSATGGQPMQVLAMCRDGVSGSHAALALLLELSSYQTAAVLLAGAGLLCGRALLPRTGGFHWLLLLGFFLHLLLLGLTLACLFSQRLAALLARCAVALLRALRCKKAETVRLRLDAQLEEYRRGARCLRADRSLALRMVLTSTAQLLALHSVTYWVYLALGLSGRSFWEVTALQAALYVAVAALPLPGAVGASESGFAVLYRTVFPAAALGGAVLLSRGISFYLMVALSGLFLAVRPLLGSRCRPPAGDAAD